MEDPEAGASRGEYMELCNPRVKIKMEDELTIKTEEGEEDMDEEVPQISNEEILKHFKPNVRHIYKEAFQVIEMSDDYIQKLIQKYHVDTNQPVTLLKRLTQDLFYKYVHEPKAGKKWKCWITSSDGVNICASDYCRKG